jgi:hypothetical protein
MSKARPILRLSFELSWVNRTFIVALAKPFVRVNDREMVLAWRTHHELELREGPNEISAFFRYRGTHVDLGTGSLTLEAEADHVYEASARNGVMNQTPLSLVVTQVRHADIESL